MTYVTLIAACARASKSEVAENMYWDLRRHVQGLAKTQSRRVHKYTKKQFFLWLSNLNNATSFHLHLSECKLVIEFPAGSVARKYDILVPRSIISRTMCRQKLEATPEAGSALIVSLCAANANERAYRVYQDMMLFAEGVSTQVWSLLGHRTLTHVQYELARMIAALTIQCRSYRGG